MTVMGLLFTLVNIYNKDKKDIGQSHIQTSELLKHLNYDAQSEKRSA